MKVGYDAKRIFHNNTGLGNYGRDVIRILHQYSNIKEFVLYNTKPSNQDRAVPPSRISIKYPSSFIGKLISSLWRIILVTKQIKNDSVSLFHGLSGEIPRKLKRNNIPSIVTIHDLIFISHPKFYNITDRIIYTKKFSYAAKNANHIIAISEQTKRDIIEYLKIDANKISVVYQGCNEAYKKTYNQDAKDYIKKKYSLPQEFVLNVGTLQERKNVLSIVKAIKGTTRNLVLIGSEKKYAEKIHVYIGEHQMQSQVIFLKDIPVEDLAIIYQLSTLFCYPSLCEGFGIPIIEALFSKVPVIASEGNCFPEAAGPNSIYVNPNDNNALKQKIETLFTNPELRKSIAEKGHQYAQKFNDAIVAKNIFNVYKSVV